MLRNLKLMCDQFDAQNNEGLLWKIGRAYGQVLPIVNAEAISFKYYFVIYIIISQTWRIVI
jgi:hypothetical protein